MEGLTRQEIDTLIEAMEAYERKNTSGDMMMDVIDMVMKGKDRKHEGELTDAEECELRSHMDIKRRERDKRDKGLKETSIILKAKLIRLRDSQTVDGFLKEVGGEE